MSTLRDDLIPVIDEGRQLADDLGLRQQSVVVLTRVWTSGTIGKGSYTDDDLVLSPVPKVRRLPLRVVMGSGGTYKEGDRLVIKISATYSAEQLGAGELAAGTQVLWLIDGEEHTLVGTPEEKNFEWRCVVRRRR